MKIELPPSSKNTIEFKHLENGDVFRMEGAQGIFWMKCADNRGVDLNDGELRNFSSELSVIQVDAVLTVKGNLK